MTYYIITKHGEGDYSLWITEDMSNADTGASVRGTLKEILEELEAIL